MKRKNHSIPIGVVFKQHNIACQVTGESVNLDEIYRKDLYEKGGLYRLRGTFKCESCGKDAERQVLYVYHKVQQGNKPYVLCDLCLRQLSAYTSKLAAEKRWKKYEPVYLMDRLDDLKEYWNFEKNTLNPEKILLRDVTGKNGCHHHTSVHLYCYICGGKCERSLRTLLNNKSKTSHSWVLCDACKSRCRTSRGEVLCLLISEYCSRKYGLVFEFQHKMEGLVSKDGYPLAFDFTFFSLPESVAFTLEIQGGLHSEKHFAESEENYRKRIERDVVKQAYCLEHNLKLVEIEYHFPNKKELRRIQRAFIQLLKDYELIPNDIDIPDFSEYAIYFTLEYQKLNANAITIKKLVTYVMEGKRVDDLTDIELIRQLFMSGKRSKTAYNHAVLPEVIHLLKEPDHSIKEISRITKVSKSAIRRINSGESYSQYTNASKAEPLKKLKRARIDEDTIVEIIKDLRESDLNMREIARKRGVAESVVSAVNEGNRYTNYSGVTKGNPIRPPVEIRKEQVLAIAELLRETNWTQKKIADYSGVTVAIVQKINVGYNHSKITGACSQDPIRKKRCRDMTKQANLIK